MGIHVDIKVDLSPRQKRWMRGAIIAGVTIAAIGVGAVLAAPIRTDWIAPNEVISASQLKSNLDDLQLQVTELQMRGGARVEWVTVPESCAASVCATTSRSVGVASVNRTQLGHYSLDFSPSFQGAPSCHVQYVKAASESFETHFSQLPTAPGASFAVYTAGAASYVDAGFMVTCVGE